MPTLPIAIIGTGLAGLAAAQRLSEAGRSLVLFEKSRGSGGRMASKRSPIGELDLGAQYFTARDPAFQSAVRDWQARGWIAQWQPLVHREPGTARREDDPQRWVGTPRMSALTRGLLGDVPVHFNCRIEQILGHAGAWQLVDAEGNRHGPFAQVIVAAPAPQASALLATAAAELAAIAASVPMRATWAVALGFAKPLPVAMQARFVRGPVLDWLACNSSKPGRDAAPQSWVLHADSDWSDEHRDLPAAEVIAHLSHAFEAALDCPLPAADFALAHRWLYARPADAQSLGALAAPAAGLYACGDWCLSGRIEGAWLSGQEAARRILEHR